MSISVDVAVRALRSSALVDPSSHLKPRGRDELNDELRRWRDRGLFAHVLVVDRGDPLPELLFGSWSALGLDARRDLLLVFDTHDWVARGWGLDAAQIVGILDAARPRERTVFSRELIGALEGLAQAAQPSALALPALGVGSVLAIGLLGLVVRRRRQLAQLGAAQLAEVQSSLGRTYAELVLACEELPEPQEASDLQLRATELKRRADVVLKQGLLEPTLGNNPVAIGQVRQLESELSALHSIVLQKTVLQKQREKR